MASNDLTAPTRRVRTRFAPSPTGFLHVGAFRTALFSYLLAHRFGGDFILRVEDTDQNRLVPDSLNHLIGSMVTLGIPYDEGPDRASVAALDAAKYGPVDPALLPEHGGDAGPYFQSQRLPRYHALIEQLLEEGKAYYAFETKEELESMRKAADIRGEPFRYNGRYRDYPAGEARDRVAKGEPHSIRFKMPTEGVIRTIDALRGETLWDARTQDDWILLKGDGFPVYHFAAMVDDHDMEISHVLRGEEWLPSAPKHFCLFAAFGWETPIFLHTPSVLGADRKKLSKRNGGQPILGPTPELKDGKPTGEMLHGLVNEEGYLEDALFNYLALTGWSPGDDSEILSQTELTERFSMENISTSPAFFDLDKLNWYNGVYIRKLSPEDLVKRALPFLIRAGLLLESPAPAERAYAASVIALEQERLKRLDEIPALTDFFFTELPEYAPKSVGKWLKPEGTAAYLAEVSSVLAAVTAWNLETVEAATREAGARHGREKGDLTHPVRVAVTGREVGPGLFESMTVLGQDRVLARLAHAVEIARG